MSNQAFNSIHFVTRGRTNRGGHVVLTNLVRELLRRDFAASVMSWHEDGKPLYPNCEELWQDVPVTIGELPRRESEEERFMVEQEALRAYVKDAVDSYDIVVLDSWLVALAAIHAGIHSRKKVFQLVQSDAAFTAEDPTKCWKAELFSLMPHVPMQRMAVSQNMVDMLANKYQQTTSYLPLFIDDAFHNGAFSVKESTPLRFMSSAATFAPNEKGLDLLLSSLARIQDVRFKLTLVTGKEIDQDLSSYPFPIEQIRAATPEEMVHIMQSHDAYLCPSIKEAFGLAQAEAITLGMPVVAMDAVGNRDFINSENALLAETKDDFIEKIRSLSSLEVRSMLHRHAKKSMESYRLPGTVDTFLGILRQKGL